MVEPATKSDVRRALSEPVHDLVRTYASPCTTDSNLVDAVGSALRAARLPGVGRLAFVTHLYVAMGQSARWAVDAAGAIEVLASAVCACYDADYALAIEELQERLDAYEAARLELQL